MKKAITCILLFSTLFILVGFDVEKNPEELLGKGEKHSEVILRKKVPEEDIVKSIEVPNDIVKQRRIYALSAGEESVTGGDNDLGIAYWNQYTNWYVYDMLPDYNKQLWDNLDILYQPYLLTDKEYEDEMMLAVKGFSSYDELFDATFIYLYCHPQYYFLRPRLSGYMYNGYYAVCIQFYDKFKSGAERAKVTPQIERWLNAKHEEICKEDSDFKRYKRIHTIICDQVYYDYDVVADEYNWTNDDHHSQSIYSGICTGKTVCAGYAKLFTCLSNAVGLDGIAVNGSGHAWNIVQLEDQWYYVDCTWDDCVQMYKYFLVNQKTFNDSSHFRNDYWGFLPNPDKKYMDLRTYKGVSYYSSNDMMLNSEMIAYNLGEEDNLNDFRYSEIYLLPTSYYSYYTAKVPLPKKISRTGYKFDGWYINDEKVKYIKDRTGDLEITVKWIPNTYMVSFGKGAKSKSVKGSMKAIKVDYDTSVELPKNNYRRKGYRFKGWSIDKNSNVVSYGDGATICNLTNDKTVKLYAVWEKEEK